MPFNIILACWFKVIEKRCVLSAKEDSGLPKNRRENPLIITLSWEEPTFSNGIDLPAAWG